MQEFWETSWNLKPSCKMHEFRETCPKDSVRFSNSGDDTKICKLPYCWWDCYDCDCDCDSAAAATTPATATAMRLGVLVLLLLLLLLAARLDKGLYIVSEVFQLNCFLTMEWMYKCTHANKQYIQKIIPSSLLMFRHTWPSQQFLGSRPLVP